MHSHSHDHHDIEKPVPRLKSYSIEVSLIVPTFNEKENIVVLLDQCEKALQPVTHEVLVVDDNSPDGTGDIVANYGKTHPNIRLIKRMEGRGLSAAVIEGFEKAQGHYLAVIDADLSHNPALLSELLKAVQGGVSVAVGSRKVPGGGADHWPWFRRLYSDVATFLARTFLAVSLRDPMSGYFMMNHDVFYDVQRSLNPKGYKILLEVVTRGRIQSLREIPYVFIDRKQGHSKLTGSVALQYLAMLWDLRPYYPLFHKLRYTYHTGRYKKVVKFLKEGRTLDIGCGQPCETMEEQAFLRFLNWPGSVGMDIKPMTGPYEFHQGSILEMTFPNESFDNVVAMEVLEHIEDVEKAVREVHRILKPGGVFVMSTPDCHWLWEFFWDRWTRLIGQMWHDAHVISMRVPEWRKLLGSLFQVTDFKRHWTFDLIFRCVKERP